MCPDCNDGFYYPFTGPPEPCLTCQSADEPTMQDGRGITFRVGDILVLYDWQMECLEICDGMAKFRCIEGLCWAGPRPQLSLRAYQRENKHERLAGPTPT